MLVWRLPWPVSSESAVKRTSPATSNVEPIARSMSPATTPVRPRRTDDKRGETQCASAYIGEALLTTQIGALRDGDVAAAVERAVAVDERAGRGDRRRAARPQGRAMGEDEEVSSVHRTPGVDSTSR